MTQLRFVALMIECHMPSIQIEHIVTSGYTTIALLAHGVHDESKMEEFVEYLSLIPAGETFVYVFTSISVNPPGPEGMHQPVCSIR